MMQQNSTYLEEFDYFRGIGIFFVVFWHMVMLLGAHEFNMNRYAEFGNLLALTFNCATALFVFMSGFMFHWIYYRRGFQFKTFLRSKFNNLFRPYFLIATIFSLTHILYGVFTSRLPEMYIWASSEIERFLLLTWMCWSFWYMPFIAIVFILSPVYLKFIELRFSWQAAILFCSLIVSCLIGRNNVNPLQGCVFFSPFYLFGIICAQNYERIKSFSIKFWIRLWWLYLMTILFVATFGQYEYGAIHLSLPNFEMKISDCTPVFKLPECLLLLWAGDKIAKASTVLKKILPTMAKYSFTIFFLHNFFIAALEEVFFWTNCEHPLQQTAWLYVVGFAMAAIVFYVCILLAVFLKKKIGKDSRIYIGT